MNENYLGGLIGLFVLLLSMLACQPVIAIGWEEFLFLFIVIAILLGPPIFRLMRRVKDFRGHEQKKK